MKTLCIIPCSKRKIWTSNPNAGPTSARLVYTGSFSRKCQEYASTFYPDSYIILSAKYGFLWPTDIVPSDYNVTFTKPNSRPISILELISSAQIKGLFTFDRFVVVAGKDYVTVVRQVFLGKSIHDPLKGCTGNGIMMNRMILAIQTGHPL